MINYHKIIQDLKLKIHGEIDVTPATLATASKDASLFKVLPKMVIYPKDKYDISLIVGYVNDLKKSDQTGFAELNIVVRAAGTDMSGGPLGNSIILDITKHLKKLIKIDKSELICEPGLFYRDAEKEMEKLGVFMPSYPASKAYCTFGGIVSNNSAGEKSLSYGQTVDFVKEVEVVLYDGSICAFKEESISDFLSGKQIEGEIVKSKTQIEIEKSIYNLYLENQQSIIDGQPKTTKNSAGYNIWKCVDLRNEKINFAKLICGSQGTLGIITKIKIGLMERKSKTTMLTVFLPNFSDLVPVVNGILKYKPEALESFDDHTFSVAIRYLPNILKQMKGNIFQMGISFLPEVWMALTGGLPKIILMAEFASTHEEDARESALNAEKEIEKYGHKSRVTKNEVDISKYWTFRRESFNLLRSKLKNVRTAPFVEDVIVPISAMTDFVPKMESILDKYKFLYTIAGHAGNGNFHIIPLMKLSDQEEVETIKNCNDEVFALVGKYGGSISAEHNDGLVRTPYLHFMFDDRMLSIFSSIKSIFDSNNIFNPGKKVGGGIETNYKLVDIK